VADALRGRDYERGKAFRHKVPGEKLKIDDMSDLYSSPENSDNTTYPPASDAPKDAAPPAESSVSDEPLNTAHPSEEQAATSPMPVSPTEDASLPKTSSAVETTLQPAPIAEPATVEVGPSRPGTRRLGVTLVLIALIFAFLGGGLLLAGYNTANAELQPAQVAQAYCQDLQAQRFVQAYALLSPSYREQVTQAQFTETSQLQDQVDGKIRGCPIATGSGIDLAFSTPKNHVAFLITILRSRPFRGHIELSQQLGTWKVEAIEQSLAGTNVDPLLTANAFCTAIIKGDYVAAYNILSSRQQSIAPETQFAQQLQSAFGGAVRLNSCTLDYTSYHVQADSAAVAMTFNLTISMSSTGSLTTGLVSVLNFGLEPGGWKLEDFTPEPSIH
jgi:hypothetical protein